MSSEPPRDHLMSIRFFAETERDAWKVNNRVRALVEAEFEAWRRAEVTTAQAFITRRFPAAVLVGGDAADE